jgi:hypothetical protein
MINEDDERPVRKLWLTLTESELRQLYQHLTFFFEDEPLELPWHMHLGDDSSEMLSIGVEKPH